MATAKFIDSSDYELRLNRSAEDFGKVAEAALRAGAAIIAAQMRQNLQGILSPEATGQLVDALGITPVKQGRDYNYSAHIGFDGYRQPPYGKFPKGVPFQLIARSFESGAGTWRPPKPFAKPAVRQTRERVAEVMKKAAEEELEKIMRGR